MEFKNRESFLFWVVLLLTHTSWFLIESHTGYAANSKQLQKKGGINPNLALFAFKSVDVEPSNLTEEQLNKFPTDNPNRNKAEQKQSFSYLTDVGKEEKKASNNYLAPSNYTQKLSNLITAQQVNPSNNENNFPKPSQPNNPPPPDGRNGNPDKPNNPPPPGGRNGNPGRPPEPPQLEGRPNDSPITPVVPIEERLEKPQENYDQRLQLLMQKLGRTEELQAETGNTDQIGTIIARPEPIEQQPIPQQPRPFKPIGYLLGRVSYFRTDNLFSSQVDPIQDGLIFSGLTLATVPVQLAPKTYLSGSVDGNLIRYVDQSEFNYNQVQLNANIYHQITPQMYGEVGWTNQQLFYARDSDRYRFSSGDRFLNENAWHISLGRRDPLSKNLMLDSYYELRWSLTGPPEKRDRIINSLWLSLNYYLQKPLQVGLNYQFNLANFTQRDREDISHRIFSHLNYRLSDTNSVSAQAGVSLGNSTEPSIDVNGWFFSINYNLELGKF
jgi:hypothetical protein